LLLARLLIDGRIRDVGLVGLRADGTAMPARAITGDRWQIDACPESGPAIAASGGGRLHLAWFTQGAVRQGLFYASTDDYGATLSQPVPLGASGVQAARAHVAASGSNVVLAWQQYDGRETTIWTMKSVDDGSGWSPPQRFAATSSAADYPFVLTHQGRFYLSWYTEDRGYRLTALPEGT
jgi:hypothetical protein